MSPIYGLAEAQQPYYQRLFNYVSCFEMRCRSSGVVIVKTCLTGVYNAG